jgi:two-component system cell cycle sensor histidine kinase/response regulator CckA
VMLRDDLPVGSPLRDDVEEIHRAAQRGADVTRQLLAFGRRQVLQPRVLDLNESAAGTARMLRRLIGEDVELVLKPAPQGVLVEADPGQLDQVIMNLAINARDAMPSGGTLTIEAAGVELDPAYAALHDSVVAGSYGMLAVSDTGAGMSKDVQARIFEPFFTTKAMGEGTGLGLATVYGIVKQSGGHIAVYSELGKGTTFRVYLPRAAGKQATPPPAAPPLRHGTETILLVEDDVQLRRLVNRVLKRQGYTVLDADGPERALAIAAEHEGPIALLLTDMVMPGGSGGELARRMLRERPELKVLYTSGYTEEEAILRHGALVPGTDFLQKPSTVEELLRKVRAILDR